MILEQKEALSRAAEIVEYLRVAAKKAGTGTVPVSVDFLNAIADELAVKDISRVRLAPEDVLIVRFQKRTNHEDMSRIAAGLKEAFGQNQMVLVMDCGAQLDVLTREQTEQRHPAVVD